MMWIRRLIYALGFRPQYGIFFSPTLYLIYAVKDGLLVRQQIAFNEGFNKAHKVLRELHESPPTGFSDPLNTPSSDPIKVEEKSDE